MLEPLAGRPKAKNTIHVHHDSRREGEVDILMQVASVLQRTAHLVFVGAAIYPRPYCDLSIL